MPATDEPPSQSTQARLLGGYTLYWLVPLGIVVGLFLVLLMLGREEESAFIYTLF